MIVNQITKKTKHNYNMIKIKEFMIVIALGLLSNTIIYASGGSSTSYGYLNIFPIIIASYYFGIVGGCFSALYIGLLDGPFMPSDRYLGIMQSPANWIFRIICYCLISIFIGIMFKKQNELNDEIIERNNRDITTGLYNYNRLITDGNALISKKSNSTIVLFKILNINEIEKYIDYAIRQDVIKHVVCNLDSSLDYSTVYSTSNDEFAVLLCDSDTKKIQEINSRLKEEYENPVVFDNYNLIIRIAMGVSQDLNTTKNVVRAISQARIALDQANYRNLGLFFYNEMHESEKRLWLEVSNTFSTALSNNEFFIVYQPIIDLKSDTICGAEILTRWDRDSRTPIGPDVFIDIAEKIGAIDKLTKWIIAKNREHQNEWNASGMGIKTYINITSRELVHSDFLDWIIALTHETNFYNNGIGFEITERVFCEDNTELNKVLSKAINHGYSISIDDFGTGFNTLMTLIDIPFTEIKIDKYFIHRIERPEVLTLIESIINGVHEMGGIVVAEGVETKEQLRVVKELGCDQAQGYCLCKPLVPHEFNQYYSNWISTDNIS